ncbi:hypothetical protein NESM_000665500 [Novymonas esmeraldas]|uniref:Uncharacterized protein n=1 Tax=Novymonas esmeraldas TaxID=1808958 RepID=A0AAW0EVN9_9TRYP
MNGAALGTCAFLPSPAVRAEAVDWVQLVTSALAVVREAPTESALHAIGMLRSYSAASPDVFTNLSHGARDVKEYVSLLCGLDDVVGAWPLRVRQLLEVPSVHLVPAGGGPGSDVAVCTPRGEALVVLFNVARYHMDTALHHLARARADASVSATVTARGGGAAVAAVPSHNAKVATQHSRLAADVLRWTEALNVGPSTASASALALQQLRSCIPLATTLDTCLLCAAVAKYTYALSSSAARDKPNLLATLAFAAAQLRLPACVPTSSSLQLLPTLLVAAYHHHKSAWYYAAEKVPDMAAALGHARYADTLLRSCDAQWAAEEAHTRVEHAARQWWGRRLASYLTGGGSSSSSATSRSAAQHAKGSGVDGGAGPAVRMTGADGGPDDASLQPATEYPHLHALLHRGEGRSAAATAGSPAADHSGATTAADVVQVYTSLHQLLHGVCAALQRLQRENELIYFAKAQSAEAVQRDVPDVDDAAAAVVSECTVFESRVQLFAGLPTAAALERALALEAETGHAQQTLARRLQRVEEDQRRLLRYVETPAALHVALDALEQLVCEPRSWGAVGEVITSAGAALETVAKDLTGAAEEWQDSFDAFIGARGAPHRSLRETLAELESWGARAAAAQQRWKLLEVPADADSRDAALAGLVPRSADIHAYLAQSEEVCRDARDVLMTSAGGVSLDQVEASATALEAVRQLGAELVASAAAAHRQHRRRHPAPPSQSQPADDVDGHDSLGPAPAYAAAEGAVEAVVEVLQSAPLVMAHVESTTAALREMQQKAVITPHTVLHDVRFLPAATATSTTGSRGRPRRRGGGGSGGSGGSPASARKRTRSPSPESPPGDAVDSVRSSTFAGVEETAASAERDSGASTAVVSGTLRDRLRSNRARRQEAERSAATAPRSKRGRS